MDTPLPAAVTELETLRRRNAELEQRLAKLTLREQELFDHLEHAATAIQWVGEDGTILWANQAELDMLGYSREELIGLPVSRLYHDPAVLADVAARLHRGEGIYNLETDYVAKDGSLRRVLVNTNVAWHEGRWRHTRCFIQDLTEHRRAEALAREAEDLRRLDALKDRFISIISHELRTPLNFITGFASTLDDELLGPLNERQHQALGRITVGADRMALLVNDLLDFAKLQAGRLDLALAPTDLAPLVEEALALMQPLAERKGITLGHRVPPGALAQADPTRVAQVLHNLLSNALKFTRAGGAVTLEAELDAEAVTLRVTDTGVGIAPEEQARLFKPFSQLANSETPRAVGTGLGLAISKALVEGHGGTIGLESRPGEGSTFWFTLPRVPA